LPPPGRVAYHRRFGRPTGLGTADRVELVINRVDALGSVQLNGELLGEIPAGGRAWRCDVTTRLTRRNELLVEVEVPRVSDDTPPVSRPGREGLPGGLIGEVRLEISSVSAARP
jgi:beta-galactosidase/beta-glucuronidase